MVVPAAAFDHLLHVSMPVTFDRSTSIGGRMSSAGDKGKGQRVNWLNDILRRPVKRSFRGAISATLVGHVSCVWDVRNPHVLIQNAVNPCEG